MTSLISLMPPASPTCFLTSAQRSQLMKSSRKLAKLLGTTPMLRVQPPHPIHEAPLTPLIPQRRTSSLESSLELMPQGSRWSMESEERVDNFVPDVPPVSAFLQEAFSIRQHAPKLTFNGTLPCIPDGAVPRTPYTPRSAFSPASPLFTPRRMSISITPVSGRFPSSILTPITPASASCEWESVRMEKEIRDRRKRLSKLARYLGEGVPADLVSVPTRRSRKPRSLSISVSSSSEHLPMPPMPTVLEDAAVMSTPTRREILSAIFEAPLPSAWSVHPRARSQSPPPPPLPVAPASSPVFDSHFQTLEAVATPRRPSVPIHQRSQSDLPFLRDEYFNTTAGDAVSMDIGHESEMDDIAMELPPRSNSRLAGLFALGGKHDHVPHAHRRERRQGWSGEWNAASVQDVIVKLRDLK